MTRSERNATVKLELIAAKRVGLRPAPREESMSMPHVPPRPRWGELAASDERSPELRSDQKDPAQELAAAVSSPEVLECAYYAAEPDLLALMRVIVRLGPQQRAQVLAYAQAMRAQAGPAAH